MNRIFTKIKSFQLGYAEEHPYPWKRTTPIVLCALFLITPFLTVLNVPLSAYNIVQEVTYQPNETLPTVFLGNLVPSVLQDPTDNFTPQQLNVGDTISLDDYIFSYIISQAFDGLDESKPVSSFPYYNNPLSDSCDSVNITVKLVLARDNPQDRWVSDVQISGTVVCYIPTLFHLTWDGLPPNGPQTLSEAYENNLISTPWMMADDLEARATCSISGVDSHIISSRISTWIGNTFLLELMVVSICSDNSVRSGLDNSLTQINIDFTVHPCCDCDAVLAGSVLETGATLLESPCASIPPRFVVIDFVLTSWYGPGAEILSSPGSLPTLITDQFNPLPGNISNASSGIVYENLIQALYHLVRLDLGVILDNQIYNSPEMFNRTIAYTTNESWASEVRRSTSNATLMAQWEKDAEFFQRNKRVPALQYFRPAPHLKPLGSAVTSVFVSTFAMRSVMWTMFSLVAGALARANSDAIEKREITLRQNGKGDRWLESGIQEVEEREVTLLGYPEEPSGDPVAELRKRMDRHDIQGVRVRADLARVRVVLRKHGLIEDESWDDDTLVE
ncbi:hypothetical protein C8R45DRAFT_1106180 [Mycena sanguinolenta]|nr:hypothetical protein C8R45DRAFT_1106180 [Mycena sanguinolenta]